MALVAVINVFLNAEFLKSEGTTDTKENLLLDAVFPIATIELVRDRAIPLGVEFIVSVKQIELDAANAHFPEIRIYGAAGIRHFHNEVRAISILYLTKREVIEVLCLVVGNLLTFRREGLGEVTIAIEETDSGHIYVAVRGFFEVVTCKDSETARIDFQHRGQTILHRVVSDRRLLGVWLHVHICAKILVNAVKFLHEISIIAELLILVVAEGVEQHYRVRLCFVPSFLVDVAEEVLGIGVPYPPEVICQFFEFLQFFRKVGMYVNVFPSCLINIANFDSHCLLN